MSPDARYFRDHPNATFRIREPLAGEVAELASALPPPGGTLMVPLEPPHPATWSVFVIRLAQRRTARVLTVVSADREASAPLILFPAALGERLAAA